ncbi:phage shock protein operon transcriptional activator [Azospirillum brasilense]|uniref:phage shock protein operon transcriptional activator n=1 Tax=Azospirillum brasilense TaxID=192 RepID=UPI000E6911D6|nr:phage shock protein operon transcriptional activator [Azospirillum brasilense]NUB28672.1 phage shock protein operon transcriptional activator [Azospirillum brasilense]NUB34085.1 phage shock protein operon transcriptional activator [Azospirillum brasilense]RIV96609.1 phage shock protein operon transcriptional activator [Azospirillum brasilense]
MQPNPPSLLGESPAFHAVLTHVSRVAPLERPLLVIGERGTGKELIAARLHYLSRRWDRPFVKVNCAALTESLLDSELFGHEAGAFTGAIRRQIGRVEQADGGTLFLDEIATASAAVQEKLLRAVEYGEIERVGGRTQTVDVRVIGATNADLPALAETGRFRADLLDRLAFDVVTLPPLRARREDIPVLAEHFALGMVRELERALFPGFAPRALEQLLDHGWPGNVRELRNAVERSVAASDPEGLVEEILLDPFASAWRPAAPAVSAPSPVAEEAPPVAAGDFQEQVRRFESGLLETALERHRFNQRQTAEALGLGYHQLRGLLKKHGLIGRPE